MAMLYPHYIDSCKLYSLSYSYNYHSSLPIIRPLVVSPHGLYHITLVFPQHLDQFPGRAVVKGGVLKLHDQRLRQGPTVIGQPSAYEASVDGDGPHVGWTYNVYICIHNTVPGWW